MIARRFVLFVGHILLFVKDDEPDLIDGRKQRGPRADDDPRFPAPHAENRVIALRQRKLAVHDDDIARKIRTKCLHELSRQGDFGHEHDDLSAVLTHLTREFDIDLRFAAPRDAVEEITVKTARVNAAFDGRDGGFLF